MDSLILVYCGFLLFPRWSMYIPPSMSSSWYVCGTLFLSSRSRLPIQPAQDLQCRKECAVTCPTGGPAQRTEQRAKGMPKAVSRLDC